MAGAPPRSTFSEGRHWLSRGPAEARPREGLPVISATSELIDGGVRRRSPRLVLSAQSRSREPPYSHAEKWSGESCLTPPRLMLPLVVRRFGIDPDRGRDRRHLDGRLRRLRHRPPSPGAPLRRGRPCLRRRLRQCPGSRQRGPKTATSARASPPGASPAVASAPSFPARRRWRPVSEALPSLAYRG